MSPTGGCLWGKRPSGHPEAPPGERPPELPSGRAHSPQSACRAPFPPLGAPRPLRSPPAASAAFSQQRATLAIAPRINMAAAASEGSPAERAGGSGAPADTEGTSAMSSLPGFDSPDAFVKVRSERGRGSGAGTTAPGVLCALGPCREL